MNRAGKEEAYPPCGYGLLGLCCSHCLLGPCRISPFEKEKERGLCGADADQLVARNLFRLALREGACALNSFRETYEKFRTAAEAPDLPVGHAGERIARKYGITGNLSGEILPALKKKFARFLYPNPPEPMPVLPSMPSLLFPANGPPDSLTGLFLDLSAREQREGREPESVLTDSLRAALLALLAEELQQDLAFFLQEEEAGDFLSDLPPTPKPLLIFVSTAEDLAGSMKERMERELKEIKDLLRLCARRAADLPGIRRVLQEKWRQPISASPVIVWVQSASAIILLGSLALGFATASFPPLPVEGSPKAERFFFSGLPREKGNLYLPIRDETIFSRVKNFFREKQP
jgi:hypothetical protein